MNATHPSSTAAAVRLLALLFGVTSMGAHADRVMEPPSDTAGSEPPAIVLSEFERVEWIEQARSDLAAASGGIGTEAERQRRAFARALQEPDPARRQARFHVWLTEYIGPAPVDEPDAEHLHRLLEVVPAVAVQHHDHPEHARPAFNIAGLAGNRIVEQEIRARSRELLRAPESIQAALLSPDEREEFRAGLLALDALEPAARAALFADPHRSFLKRPQGAAATLALVERGWLTADMLLPVIEQAEPQMALRAFRQSRTHGQEVGRRAVESALARPELGGLPVAEAAKAADPKLRATVWSLLGDAQRGADAALALARHDDALEARIDAGFDAAGPLARLRMLLALRLRATPSSLALLDRLRSQRLNSTEFEATEAWQ